MSRVGACVLIAVVALTVASCRRPPSSTLIGGSRGGGSGPPASLPLGLDGRVDALLNGKAGDAAELAGAADRLKSDGQFEEAAVHYLAALRLQPKLAYVRYQYACNLALWDHADLAIAELRRAVDDGFWGYEMMRSDDDLESIWNEPEFKTLLAAVQKRYPAEAAKRAGQSLIAVPEGQAPARGWPVVVYLHGMGDRPASYRDYIDEAAGQGYAGVALAGPVVQWDNQYAWPAESVEPTHRHLRTVLDSFRDKNLDRSRVYLIGFSQGAIHAAGLVAAHTSDYAGAIVLSPGGPPRMQGLNPSGPARPACVIYGQRELEGNKQESNTCAAAWRRAGWPVLQETHPGSHHPPEDWEQRFPRLMKWLEENSR